MQSLLHPLQLCWRLVCPQRHIRCIEKCPLDASPRSFLWWGWGAGGWNALASHACFSLFLLSRRQSSRPVAPYHNPRHCPPLLIVPLHFVLRPRRHLCDVPPPAPLPTCLAWCEVSQRPSLILHRHHTRSHRFPRLLRLDGSSVSPCWVLGPFFPLGSHNAFTPQHTNHRLLQSSTCPTKPSPRPSPTSRYVPFLPSCCGMCLLSVPFPR